MSVLTPFSKFKLTYFFFAMFYQLYNYANCTLNIVLFTHRAKWTIIDESGTVVNLRNLLVSGWLRRKEK